MVDLTKVQPYLNQALGDIDIAGLPNHSTGKVRDSYDLADGRRIIIASDRLSAFDQVLTTIPLKGQALTQIARFWFEATKDICPNHIEAFPHPNVTLCQHLTIMPIEIVVRRYLTGTTNTSIWPMYKAGQRHIYGIDFPDGLRENQVLPHAIVTPTTKASIGGHDEPISAAEIIERGLLTQEQWQTVSIYALALFQRGTEIARDHGLILADTKYEFGFDPAGRIVLADEIHTPDSSRYWLLKSYDERFQAGTKPESFDKDVVRNWVAARCDPYKDPIPAIPDEMRLQAAATYISVYETITGKGFDWPDPSVSPLSSIRAALTRYMTTAR
jgi:phosphoribosylaminoimidazole-succinocarboxamide synthase